MVSRHGYTDCIVLVKPFLRLQEVENALLEVVKHANVHDMQGVGLQEVPHDRGNMSKHIESLVDIA